MVLGRPARCVPLPRRRFRLYTTADGLPDNWVRAVCVDREGNLWIGTESGGLSCWVPRRVGTLSMRDGLGHENAWTLCEAPDGRVRIGTDGGLSGWRAGQFTHYTEASGLSKNVVRALACDSAGELWVGTGGGGLDVLSAAGWRNVRLPGELSGNKVRALHVAPDGALWVGTERGLHALRGGEWSHFGREHGISRPSLAER
ncbi:MAG: hypothetical protein FJ387_25180 [Verrucomicrobia bacterium]|nr:hypothetical protein [Verrucomicrobiota bacterium]